MIVNLTCISLIINEFCISLMFFIFWFFSFCPFVSFTHLLIWVPVLFLLISRTVYTSSLPCSGSNTPWQVTSPYVIRLWVPLQGSPLLQTLLSPCLGSVGLLWASAFTFSFCADAYGFRTELFRRGKKERKKNRRKKNKSNWFMINLSNILINALI